MSFPFWLSFGALWLLVLFLSLVVLGLVRTVYRLQRDGAARAGGDGTLRGQPIPEFTGVDLSGEPVTSATIAGQLTALLFVGSDCASCAMTLHDLDALHAKADSLIVICQGDGEACTELAETYRIVAPVVPDKNLELSELFQITTVPTAVIASKTGTIASIGHPLGRPQLEELIGEARREDGEPVLVAQHHGPGGTEEEGDEHDRVPSERGA